MNRNNDSIIELWGRAFTKAKKGLDEEQVKSFVYELLSESHLLTRQQGHISRFATLPGEIRANQDSMICGLLWWGIDW